MNLCSKDKNDKLKIGDRGRTIICKLGFIISRFLRKTSRITRLARFRSTASPSLRVAMIPRMGLFWGGTNNPCIQKASVLYLVPFLLTSSNW